MTNRGPGPIPNRWLHCPRKSTTLIAERFLAFKTPLSNAFKDQMPNGCGFTPEMILTYCKTTHLKLGLWIDLTNTKRFYDREVVEGNGTKYVKLQCRGHGETPSPEQTQSFIEIVDSFIEERPCDVIAVHCTHGFNRTGFLIVSYLVERLDCSVEAALSIFATARPPGIYKQDYINELFQRYDDKETPLMAPELPDWCVEFDDSDRDGNRGSTQKPTTSKRARDEQQFGNNGTEFYRNGEVAGGGDSEQDEDADYDATGGGGVGNGMTDGSNNKKAKKRRRELVIKDASFMKGVSGVVLVTDQPRLSTLQKKIQDMCGWESNGFPGAQPVSMNRENLERLRQIPYMVSWKADGTRYMMLIVKRDEVYFFDRNLSCFHVENVSFVEAGNLTQHLTDTLLDGEMVLDKFNGETTPRYLIYDIIKIKNTNIGKKEFPERLRCIKKEIVEPRYEAFSKGIINRAEETFSVRNKDFWDIWTSASLLGEKFAKSLAHEPDGLIFQPCKAPYTPGPCPDVLKWKPLDMNSVDFRLKIGIEDGMGIVRKKIGLLYVGGFNDVFAKIKLSRPLKELENKIIECTYDMTKCEWQFLRERVDKTLPNSYNTASSVFQSIKEPVTTKLLLDFIAKYGYRNDNDRMPPPAPHMNHQRPPSQYHHQHHHQHQQQHQQQQQLQLQQQQQQHQHQQQQQQQHHHQQQQYYQQQQHESQHSQYQQQQHQLHHQQCASPHHQQESPPSP